MTDENMQSIDTANESIEAKTLISTKKEFDNETQLEDIKHANAEAKQKTEQYAMQQTENAQYLENKANELAHLQKETIKEESELEKLEGKYRKVEAKQLHELEKQEAKTIELAKKLEYTQAEHAKGEQDIFNHVAMGHLEAKALAEQLMYKRTEDRKCAQRNVEELAQNEEDSMLTAHQLADWQEQERKDFETKIATLTKKESIASEHSKELFNRRDADNDFLDKKASEYKHTSEQVKAEHKLACEQEEESIELERKAENLSISKERTQKRLEMLFRMQEQNQNDFQHKIEELADNQEAICTANCVKEHHMEERKLIESQIKELSADTAEAKKNAEKLARKQAQDTDDAIANVTAQAKEEFAAKRKIEEMNTREHWEEASFGNGRRVVDTYQHTRTDSNVPNDAQVTAIVTNHLEEKKSAKGPIDKIVDVLKNL